MIGLTLGLLRWGPSSRTAVADMLRHPLLRGRVRDCDPTLYSCTSGNSPMGVRSVSAFCKHPVESVVGGWGTQRFYTRPKSVRVHMVSCGGAACARIVYVGQFEAGGVQRFCKHPVESGVGGWGHAAFLYAPPVCVGGLLRWARLCQEEARARQQGLRSRQVRSTRRSNL